MHSPLVNPPGTPLVSAARLHDMLAAADPPVLLDARWALATGADHAGYASGHLPGARFVHMERDLSGAPGLGGRHPLPGLDAFAQAMRRAGVSDGSVVVCYDAGPGLSAARAWWLLRHAGHRQAYVLDGGLAAWTHAGLPLTTEEEDAGAGAEAVVSPGDFTVRPSLAPAIDASDVLLAARDGLLLDARDRDRYLGITEPVDKVAGHIPGAVSAPTAENIGPDGTLRPPAELRNRFTELGVSADRPVTVYCGSGVTAAHEILALEAAGYQGTLYPGSWSNWIEDPTRPVETGAP
jgi:thiosulfate/3-mercaptopyruvate sulfurtransferase